MPHASRYMSAQLNVKCNSVYARPSDSLTPANNQLLTMIAMYSKVCVKNGILHCMCRWDGIMIISVIFRMCNYTLHPYQQCAKLNVTLAIMAKIVENHNASHGSCRASLPKQPVYVHFGKVAPSTLGNCMCQLRFNTCTEALHCIK